MSIIEILKGYFQVIDKNLPDCYVIERFIRRLENI